MKIHGMIYKIRKMSGFAFILLRTKNEIIQCVYSGTDELKENMSVIFDGEQIANTSATEPLVMLKHFAENPELAAV